MFTKAKLNYSLKLQSYKYRQRTSKDYVQFVMQNKC